MIPHSRTHGAWKGEYPRRTDNIPKAMPLLTEYERTYSAPPDPPKSETEGERKIDPNETQPFHVGVVDRRAGLCIDDSPFVTTANRELWEMGWESEDEKQKGKL